MPVTINDPVVIPARAELSANQLNIESLSIGYNRVAEKYSANVTLSFFAMVDDKRVYARDDNGTLKTVGILVPDLYVKAAEITEVGTAIQAILSAVAPLYTHKLVSDAAEAAAKASAEAAYIAARAANEAAAAAAQAAKDAANS